MKRNFAASNPRAFVEWNLTLACFFLFACVALAQSGKPTATNQAQANATVPALLVSDIHFEPFWDSGKAQQLAAAPVSQWNDILAAPPSPDRAQRFAAIEQSCGVRGADTSFPLLQSSLKAMSKAAASAGFVTVSGDLISHAFACKYNTLFPRSTESAYRGFIEKTVDYVIEELYGAFPGIPVYVAMGNNDSDCGDYQLDAHGEFLSVIGKEVTRNFPAADREGALATFAAGGYYSVRLPAPVSNARLLVLNDIFMSKNYSSCAGQADPGAVQEQMQWLGRQLAEARANKQKVWVMGHIPPGIDLYATARKWVDVCGGQKPDLFLSSQNLADVLAKSGDVIELAIFAHTHMDELRLLKSDGQGPAADRSVAVKMVPSISPIHGNRPAFIVAQVDPFSASLVDYKVFAASNQTGVDAAWKEEYDFARSFGEHAFTSSSVKSLIAGFAADPHAKTNASRNYIEDFSAGYLSPVLAAFWPQYVCTLSNGTAQSFRSCVCSTAQ
jgi:sphingomyelin phosphodiesterase acid-like 3